MIEQSALPKYNNSVKYAVIITRIKNPRSRVALAHHLAQAPGVSLQDAHSMLDRLPVVYEKEITKQEVIKLLPFLKKQGVLARIKQVPGSESENPPPPAATAEEAMAVVERRPVKKTGRTPSMEAWSSGGTARTKITRVLRRRLPRSIGQSVFTVICAVVLIGVIGLVVRFSGGDSIRLEKTNPLSSSKEPGSGFPGAEKSGRAGEPGYHTRPPAGDRRQSQSYSDSADACGNDYARAIKFYTIALSFNKYNVHAWYGLIGAYRNAGMNGEAEKTRREMRALLGSESLSVAGIIEPFGTVRQVSHSPEGVYRVEYRTRLSGEEPLLRETYAIVKALRTMCNCRSLSVFAATGAGRGMLAHVGLDKFPRSLSDYRREAAITYFE